MRPWKLCNSRGKLLICCCILNCILAADLALGGHWLSILCISSAAFCALGTYSAKCCANN